MSIFKGFFRETARLILREATAEDAAELAQKRSTPFVMRYNLYEPCGSAQLATEIATYPYITIENRTTGEIIGAISLRDDDFRYHMGAKEMAAWLTEAHAHQGLMAEAIPPVMDAIFKSDIERLSVRIFAPNTASIRLAEKLGFSREGYLTRAVKKRDGTVFDAVLYTVSKEEFLQQK